MLLSQTPLMVDNRDPSNRTVILCLSHLRWSFVFQRPQHLMTHACELAPVLFFEEPLAEDILYAKLVTSSPRAGITVLTPVVPINSSPPQRVELQRQLLDEYISTHNLKISLQWYYTPMAWAFTSHLHPEIVIFDCMDQLSAFDNPPPHLIEYESQLLAHCDLVFTGGQSLFQAKKDLHDEVHCFPSAVDASHFRRARLQHAQPADQASLPYPRVGFAGVVDERMDLDLVAYAAMQMPHVQFVMIGPVVKIDPETLPVRSNIHWLGMKDYGTLPSYMSGWTAAWMPFALNKATRYISPTKTPEYLAAGLPVVSTAIADVVSKYGALALATIVDKSTVVEGLDLSIAQQYGPERLQQIDLLMAEMSWDSTWSAMAGLISRKIQRSQTHAISEVADV